jgi:hypothetical protein
MARRAGSTSSITLTSSASPVAAKSSVMSRRRRACQIDGPAARHAPPIVAASQASHTSAMARAVAPARALSPALALQHHDRRGEQHQRQRGERRAIDARRPRPARRAASRAIVAEQRRAVQAGDDEALRVRVALAERSPGHRAVGVSTT